MLSFLSTIRPKFQGNLLQTLSLINSVLDTPRSIVSPLSYFTDSYRWVIIIIMIFAKQLNFPGDKYNDMHVSYSDKVAPK